MKWADKQQAWAWRQIRIVRAVADAALTGEPASPNPVLDTITEVATLNGLAPDMEEQLAVWEQQYQQKGGA